MPMIVIDPVSRIVGHMRIEARVEGGKVVDAWSSGTSFRDIENILRGRDPRDAWLIAQRICGVCTTVHATSSVRAVEHALGICIPENARVIRNLISGVQYIHDHVTHFYHLHALDWVDVMSALKADPSKTSSRARSLADRPLSSISYFRGIQRKIATLVDGSRSGIFSNGYWGHSAYKLTPEANLMILAHYIEALDWQRDIIKIHALLGAKNPHPQTYLVGGMSIPVDPKSDSALNEGSIEFIARLARKITDFVEKAYIPDLRIIAASYKEWFSHGAGAANLLACGDFPNDSVPDTMNLWLPRGIIINKDLNTVHSFDQKKIMEQISHSWYEHREGNDGRHPYAGETIPRYSGPKPPFENAFVSDRLKYSWVKAPRYGDLPMEVGPLARILVAYASGHKRAKEVTDGLLHELNIGIDSLWSTLGRVAARGIETLITAEMLPVWLNQLAGNMKGENYGIHSGGKWEPSSWPKEAMGYGFHEAPRGCLGHWISIKDGKIENYQCVAPDTWNGSPRDARGRRGPYEASLIGIPVADPNRPIEILRTIRAFDPCMACATH